MDKQNSKIVIALLGATALSACGGGGGGGGGGYSANNPTSKHTQHLSLIHI